MLNHVVYFQDPRDRSRAVCVSQTLDMVLVTKLCGDTDAIEIKTPLYIISCLEIVHIPLKCMYVTKALGLDQDERASD